LEIKNSRFDKSESDFDEFEKIELRKSGIKNQVESSGN
jgi:hypothetical protein